MLLKCDWTRASLMLLAICHLLIRMSSPAFRTASLLHSWALLPHSLLSVEQNRVFSFSSFSYQCHWHLLFFMMMLTEKILSLPLPFQQNPASPFPVPSLMRTNKQTPSLDSSVFFCLCASEIIKSWCTTYLLQFDREVSLQFTWLLFLTTGSLWP